MKRRPTIIDVALQAGVSKTTVSRVIGSEADLVREETRNRVLDAIETLGYQHNAVARSLRTDRTNIIMLAIPDITNPFWPGVARGVQDVMDSEGYAVVFANSDWNGPREALFLQMAARNRFDGILINPIQISNDTLKSTGIPTVILSSSEEYPDFDCVGSDSYGGTRLALEHLFAQGHRRIGLISGQRQQRSGHSRRSSYTDFLNSHSLPEDKRLIVDTPFDQAGGFNAMQQLLDLPEPPTAVCAANDILAIGALRAALESGLKIPRLLSIVGMDDIFASSTTTPPLTTVVKSKNRIGQLAAHFLIDRIRGLDHLQPRHHLIPCILQLRGSTAPLNI
ncbi:MAG: LacI family transcriptional regulator [Chloroflexi bacterium]|nr:LacI family transcriptional regulator [Chloroflexota bacterium]